MASSTAPAADPTDVVIHLTYTGWSANDYSLDYDDVSVSFFNSATLPCLIIFVNAHTFGTSFLGLAPQGTISLNVLKRAQTKYTVGPLYPDGTNPDIGITTSQQYTIDMN